ncbi:MAG: hypothetical protein GTO45_05665, partial [Candidatus Aminicenantes bacterium]|nr:hypothetical protein [Candidatus Aminicenantes bacterium]NIM78338.1 hypothetical protein [Candidatus Aminicenantes bacterium]NIN17572.1 hypothetical protein [Candidatus Aminicenantes bacterium]NIN41450.1 hypothetical protein [Candidatus Aminicenantes bacterium]NIN84224.1 hypothetical protein [Candidatus Aminicenantes bacterium]
PVKKGYIFYPSKRQCDETTADGKIEFRYKAELDRKFFIAVTGNQMLPSEGSFDDVYGKSLFSPEIKAGYKFYRDFYVWGGYSFLSKNGKSYPEFKEPAKWEEKFLSLGLGYFGNFSITFGWKAEVGLIYVSFTEKMSQIEEGEVVDTFSESGNALGLRIGGASIFKFSDRLFTEISLGYLFASDKVNEISIKLGGLRAGIGLGVRF